MKRKSIVVVVLSLLLLILLTGCCLSHEWEEATCTAPQTCAKCGKTEGEALGHTWTDATCTEDAVCTVCGEKGTSALGHTIGDWEIQTEATKNSDGEQVKKCAICGEVFETKIYRLEPESITVLTDDGFTMTREEYHQHLLSYLSDEYTISGDHLRKNGEEILFIYWQEGEPDWAGCIAFIGSWLAIDSLLDILVHSLEPSVIEADDSPVTMEDIHEAWAQLKTQDEVGIPLYTGIIDAWNLDSSTKSGALFCTKQFYQS